MSTDGARQDLARLLRLRERFLDAGELGGPVADYWRDGEDLAAYDAVFAARIGWKWDAVVGELRERAFGRTDDALVLDWGCGTGIAGRRFAAELGAKQLLFHDRSPQAMEFATEQATRELAATDVASLPDTVGIAPDVLLISHVLDELGAEAEAGLLELATRSARIVWVEPGSRVISRRLGNYRERLCGEFHVVAPCTHPGTCGVLAASDDRHWCHFFAPPPIDVFTDGAWVSIGRELGLDLRALPYAFIALSRHPAPPKTGAARILGRPEVRNKEARVFACDAEGLHRLRAFKSGGREAYRLLKKHSAALRTVRITRDDDRIVALDEA